MYPTTVVTIAKGQGWEGFYVDGELRNEGVTIDSRSLNEALAVESFRLITIWTDYTSNLPEKLTEVFLNGKAQGAL